MITGFGGQIQIAVRDRGKTDVCGRTGRFTVPLEILAAGDLNFAARISLLLDDVDDARDGI